jgi:hypothetical protein
VYECSIKNYDRHTQGLSFQSKGLLILQHGLRIREATDLALNQEIPRKTRNLSSIELTSYIQWMLVVNTPLVRIVKSRLQ